MINDKITQAVSKALEDIKNFHQLESDEIYKVASLISALAKSSPEIRMFFYAEATKIAYKIADILKEKEEKLLAEIKKIKDEENIKDDDDILN